MSKPTLGYRTIGVEPLTGVIGAEITGVDLAAGPSEEQLDEVRQAFHAHGVIFFRDSPMTPDQQLALARRFGPVNVNRFFTPVPGHPDVAEVRKEPDDELNIGADWHTDHSYDETPALGSLLHAVEMPAVGGDTLFASMYAAYDALSPGMKRMLGGLEAEHSSRHIFGPGGRAQVAYPERMRNPETATQDAVHPVVIRHPATGRAALYVNRTFTVRIRGWSDDESRALLEQLYQHASRPEFTCRFRWRAGSTALWDNRCTWHYAVNDYPGERRLMHRVTIDGTALEAMDLQDQAA